ncbi:biotin-dependent carboxyltransferase family protein [Gallibacterium trehalosifermentans]|uniref:Biotin-dependent carboxyltransferase family protein n=1 Tax=Gallibacterium trehalosifermentans TaxID=516935 RepID=A0ABV6H243_9PAST
MIYIEKISGFAHIQDLGRFGYRNFGIGHAGAMDPLALQAGNLLLENTFDASAIELSLGGITLTFDCDTPFCLTGALCEAYLDDNPIYAYWRYTAKAKQRLTIKRLTQGNYCYLCVAGGFLVPQVLGSYSTDLKAGFGGYKGRCLAKGDHIPTGKRDLYLSSIGIEPIAFTNNIYFIASSEFSAFTSESQQYFTQQTWSLSQNSNRMGYRFSGEKPLQLKQPLEMLSYAAPMGTVQVPPDGQPIILMADTQTTGGYPKIACVIQADLGRLAQNKLGDPLQFHLISRQQALEISQQNQLYLENIRRTTYEAR